MNIEQELMHQLKRACAALRRHPPRRAEGGGSLPPRGFGHILELLCEQDGISQQQIAERLGIRPQSVSEAITVLEERGFILKEQSPTDRRVTLIFLTVAGLVHAEQLAEQRRALGRRVFAPLSEAEKEQLLSLLTRINADREEV